MQLHEAIIAGGLLLISWIFVFLMWIREMKKEYDEIEVLQGKEKE